MSFLPNESQRDTLTAVFQAYNDRNYLLSERLSRELCLDFPDSMLVQIFLISSMRLERSDAEINKHLVELMKVLELDQWEVTLLKITTGQESNVESVFRFARTERHRCSLYYYIAQRMVFMGLPDAANQGFAASANCKVDNIEQRLAVIECETRGITVNEVQSDARARVDKAYQHAYAIFGEKDYARALPAARAALQLAEELLGENFISTSACLNSVGATLLMLGQKAEARPYFQRALAVQRKVFTDKHDDVIGSLGNLASLCEELGDLESSLQCYAQIVAIRRKWRTSEDGNAADLADALATLGTHLHSMGRFNEATSALEEVLDIRRQKLGDDNEDTARAMANLGGLLSERGDYAKAREYYRLAIPVLVKTYGPDHPQTAVYYSNFASLLSEMGEYDEALILSERAYSILASKDEKNPFVAKIRLNLANMVLRKGDVTGARAHFEQALFIVDQAFGDHPDTAQCLNNLGNFLRQELGDFIAARPYLERSLAIRKKFLGANHPDTATTLNNLGQLLEGIGDSSGARKCYEEALAIRRVALGDSHPKTAQVLNNLGVLYAHANDPKAARRYEEEAIKIREKALPTDHPDLAFNHAALGTLLRGDGDVAGAKMHFERALAICQKAFGGKHLYVALSLSNLGLISQDQGQVSAAQSYHTRALAMVTEVMGESHPQRISCLVNLALSYAASGRFSEAIGLMNEAAEVDDRMIGQVFSLSSDNRREEYLVQIRLHLDISLHLASQRLSESDHARKIAIDLVLRRKGLAAEALLAQREAVWSGKYPHLQSQFKELTGVRSLIAQAMLDGPGERALDIYRAEIREWTTRREQLEATLAQQIPEMNFGDRLRATDSQAVAMCLPASSALVEFIRFVDLDFEALDHRNGPTIKPQRYLAFVILAGRPNDCQMIDLGDAERIDRLAADFRSVVTSRSQDQPRSGSLNWQEIGIKLRQTLFTKKMVDAFQGRNRLILAPDSQLNLFPFEVLPTDDARFLMDEYELSYMNCGREALRFAQACAGDATPPLVVADPDFDLAVASPGRADSGAATPLSREFDRGIRFGRLAATREEGEQVAALLHVEPLIGREALERSIKSRRSPYLLHLATHGFFLRDEVRRGEKDLKTFAPTWPGGGRLSVRYMENPLLRSGLALAGANTWLRLGAVPEEAEDGLLTAQDVTGMDLLNTDLVVLSACETALGLLRIGEGVYGLRRAFALAGARTLVMSLWKVPDDQTRDLMIEFYVGLLKGMDVAKALHEAQRTVRKQHPEPYYWGAFICQGSTSPLKAKFTDLRAQ